MNSALMSDNPPPLHLPAPLQRRKSSPPRRARPLRRRDRWRQAAIGLAMAAGGTTILLGLVQVPERIDTQLLVSDAVSNVMRGLGNLFLGIFQLAGVVATVILALLALLLLLGGALRLLKALFPPPPRTERVSQPCSRCSQIPASCQEDQRKASRKSQFNQEGLSFCMGLLSSDKIINRDPWYKDPFASQEAEISDCSCGRA